jgi:hypothetical protein
MGGRFSAWALLLLAIAAIVDAGPGPLLAPMRLFPSFDERSAQPPWVVAYAAIESTKVNVAGKCTAFATQASDLCNKVKAQMGPEGYFSPAAKDSRREYLQSLPPAQKTAILMVLALAQSHLTRPKRRHGLAYCDYHLLSFVRTHISQQRRRLSPGKSVPFASAVFLGVRRSGALRVSRRCRAVLRSWPHQLLILACVRWQLAGGVAGATAKTCVAPLERIKLLAQAGELKSGVWQGMVEVVEREGMAGLWRGNTVNVLRMVPNKGVLHATNDLYKEVAAGIVAGLPAAMVGAQHSAQFFLAGSLAGMTCRPRPRPARRPGPPAARAPPRGPAGPGRASTKPLRCNMPPPPPSLLLPLTMSLL